MSALRIVGGLPPELSSNPERRVFIYSLLREIEARELARDSRVMGRTNRSGYDRPFATEM